MRQPATVLPLQPPVGLVSASMTGTITTDADSDSKADPQSDTITYTATVSNNSGSDLSGLQFNDTVDAHTTLVPGSLKIMPLARDDSYAVAASGTLNIPAAGVLSNDLGSPAPTVTAVNGSAANVGNPLSIGGGTLTLNSDGSFTYNAPATTGPVNFTYDATNSAGTDTATVTIDVQPPPDAVNDAPAGNSVPGDAYHTAVDTLLDSTGSYSVLDNDTPSVPVVSFGPATGGETSAGGTGASAQGGTVVLQANGQFTYMPPSGYTGYDTLVYKIQNGIGSDTAVVTIAIGVRPTANNDSYNVIVNGTLNISAPGVLSNDTGSSPLTVTQVNGSGANVGVATPVSGGGTVTLNSNGSFTYNAPAATGPVTFTYTAANALSSSSASVTITVQSAPVANIDGPAGGSIPGDPYHTGMNQSITGPTAYNVLSNDTGSSPLSVVSYGVLGNEAVPTNATPTTQGGSITLNTAGNIVSYIPPSASFVGVDTFKYTMTSNVGGSATTTVTIKVGVPPSANPDAYNVYGNIAISINTANGSRNNDTGDQIVIQSYCGGILPGNNCTTANGGTLNMAADGSFAYNPPVGYIGNDTVNYVISNGLGTSNANITFTIANKLWFIDGTTGAGDGRRLSPFNSISAFTAVNDGVGVHPKAGDRIYIACSSAPCTYSTATSLQLLDNQVVIGAGSDLATIIGALPLGSAALPGAGTKPNVRTTAANYAIDLASGNTVRGLDLGVSGNTTARGISNVSGSAGNVTILDSVTINANGGPAVNIFGGGTMNVTFGSITSASSSANGIVVGSMAGTFTVSGTTSITSSTNAAVSLTSNTGTITFAALNIDNSSTNVAGVAASSNTGTITATSGTLNTGSSQAVNIDGSAGTTPLAMTLTSVTSSGGSTSGILLNKTSGSFTVTGTGSANSGGTISNKTGNVDGINLANAVNVSLNYMLISGNTRAGIFGNRVNGFVLANSTVQNNGDSSPTAGALQESGVVFTNLSGTLPAGANPTSISSSTITGNAVFNVYLSNDSVTLAKLDVLNSSITNNSAAFGSDGFYAEASSAGGLAGNVVVNVNNSSITNNQSDGIQANCLNNGNIDLTVQDSTISGGKIPINLTTAGTCDLTFDILSNDSATPGDGLLNFTSHGINLSTIGNSTASGTISNNTITGNNASNVGLGIQVRADNASNITTVIDGNTISNTGFAGIEVASTTNATGTLSSNILNNNVTAPLTSAGGDDGIRVMANNAGGSPTLCVDVFGNTAGGSAGNRGVRMEQDTGSTLRLERLAANQGPGGQAAVQAQLDGTNTLAPASIVSIATLITAVANGFCSTPSTISSVQKASRSEYLSSLRSPEQQATTPISIKPSEAPRPIQSAGKTGANPSAARRLHHIRSAKLEASNSKPRTAPSAGCATPGINPAGTAVCVDIPTLHNGESIQITYQVTVKNPPNLSGVPPGTPQVSNFGILSGPFGGSPLNTNTIDTPVDLFDSTTTLASNINPENQTYPVTFTATVGEAPAQPTIDPTGTVNFIDTSNGNAVICGNVALSGGSAQCQTSSLSVGTHNIRADYSGDGNFDPSLSNIVAQAINACLSNPVVTNTNDNGTGSLRDAIANVCSAPNNNITFNIPNGDPNHAGGVYTITLTGGELSVPRNVNIIGPNSVTNTDAIKISGNNISRVFHINNATVTLDNLTITNGLVTGGTALGGGIYNDHGILTLSNSTVSNSTADYGGAISNDGDISGSASLTIVNSAMSGNTASYGGGVYNKGVDANTIVNLTNSTISGNNAVYVGGGILTVAHDGSNAPVAITNSTITNNRANSTNSTGCFAGGLAIGGPGVTGLCGIPANTAGNLVTLRNSIVALNYKGASPATTADDIAGAVNVSGSNSTHNIVGTCASCNLVDGTDNNKLGVTSLQLNLGPLQINGGNVQTHALGGGSVALDAGNNTYIVAPPFRNTVPINDQRGTGFPRIVDSGVGLPATATVDVGAYELQPPTAQNDTYGVTEDTPLIQAAPGVLGNDTPASGGGKSASLVTGPLHAAAFVLNADGSFSYTPAADYNGRDQFTYTFTEANGGSANATVTLNITPVNDTPSFTKGPDINVNANSGGHSFPGWATNIMRGPATATDETGQTVNFIVSNNNNVLFSVQPAVDSTGTLTFTVAAGQAGQATVSVQIHDNGGGADTSAVQQFIITVTSVDLTPTKSHVGNFKQGDTGKTYKISVKNIGQDPSAGLVTLADSLPAGLIARSLTGSGWTCDPIPGAGTAGPATLNCTRSDSLAGSGATYPDITLTVDVACNAPASVTNTATVSGGNDASPGNNTSNDATTVNPDNIPPVIVCPGGISKYTDSGQNSAVVNPGVPATSDNCGQVSVTGTRSDGKPLNAPFPVGITIITWTAKDSANNTATCAQSVTVMVPSSPHRIPGTGEEALLTVTDLLMTMLLAVW